MEKRVKTPYKQVQLSFPRDGEVLPFTGVPFISKDREMDERESEEEDDDLWQDKVAPNGEVLHLEPNDSVEYIRTPAPDTIIQDSYSKKSKKSVTKKMKKLLQGKDSKLSDTKIKQHNMNNHAVGHGVTFNDVPTGLLRDVIVFVDPYRSMPRKAARASACERLFGISPGTFGSPSTESDSSRGDKRIMVQGLLPNGEAAKSGVKIGEWLMCVNDLEVTWDNIDSILSGITVPKYIKLTLQRIAIQTSPQKMLVKKTHFVDRSLVKLVEGSGAPPSTNSDLPHGVMCLKLDISSDTLTDNEDIMYIYSSTPPSLKSVRGVFSTVVQLLVDVTHNQARSSTIIVNKSTVYVQYYRESNLLLVLCLPAQVSSLHQSEAIMSQLVRLIKLCHGSLHNAFKSGQSHMDHVISLFFYRILPPSDGSVNSHLQLFQPFFDVQPAVRSLTLPDELKVLIDKCLTDLEAAEFADMSEEFYCMRRLYTIMGSCVFYKGYLLGSHLHRADLLDLGLYLGAQCLLGLHRSEQLGQVVLWREVHPTRIRHQLLDPLLPGFTDPDARYFILAVGLKNLLLGVLLEAGGCATRCETNPAPDAFYIDQVKATLLQMDAQDVVNICDQRITGCAVPSLASLDWFIPVKSSSSKHTTLPAMPAHSLNTGFPSVKAPKKPTKEPESILKKSSQSSLDGKPKGRGLVYDPESDADTRSTGGTSDGSNPVFQQPGSLVSDESLATASSGSSNNKSSRKKRALLTAYDIDGLSKQMDIPHYGRGIKLTSGCDNTLFQYVSLDQSEGIFICPTEQEIPGGVMNKKLMEQFQLACLQIQELLHTNKRDMLWNPKTDPGLFGRTSVWGRVYEHGILFEAVPSVLSDSKKPLPDPLYYWVIGRIQADESAKEFYVCFHESVPQNTVELAFKLGFGNM